MSRGPAAPLVRAFGDAAVLVEAADLGTAQRVARELDSGRVSGSLAGVDDVVLGFGTVTVTFDPRRTELDGVFESVSAEARRAVLEDTGDDGADDDHPVEITVRFDGPDLADVAESVGWTAERVVEALAAAPLSVAFVGFSPGFAYLHGLPPELAGLPRRHRPRPSVPAGSVAVGGGFAAVYPQATPGGWHLVGRTGAVLFDPDRPPHALLAPGRRVRLLPTGSDVPAPPSPSRSPLSGRGRPSLVVVRPGSCTLVEDDGRRGVASLGVPGAGAMDPLALALANRLVGNDATAAALEVTAAGPGLRAAVPVHAAVLGTGRRPPRLLLAGHPVPAGEVLSLGAGSVLEVAGGESGRALVAVSGGIETPSVLGSRSSDVLAGLGPGPLRAGDELPLGAPGRPRGWLRYPDEDDDGTVVLRVVTGPDAGHGPHGTGQLSAPLGGAWVVAPDSNRVGVRLRPSGPRAAVPELAAVASRGMVRGAVQCPPGGELVVLGPDHATVGGYPVPAVVVSADLHRLAALVPGAEVRFAVVGQAEARRALARLEARAASAVGGWFPTLAG